MAIFDLVRYKYGTGGRYTAFCLTPKHDKPVTRIFHGRELVSVNEGPGSPRAVHFQNPAGAKEWASRLKHRISGWTADPSPGTKLWP